MDDHGARDLSAFPLYAVQEAARFLRIPRSTVRAWIHGQAYATPSGAKRFRRVIVPAEPNQLSFRNLVELFVLQSIRKIHEVPLPKVRDAMERLRQRHGTEHPLAEYDLLTDRRDLFIEELGEYTNISQSGQREMRQALVLCMSRVERGGDGLLRLHPPSRKNRSPRLIVINPGLRFGRPCIIGTAIPTEMIFYRNQAGESVPSLASDYECDQLAITEAIKYEEFIRAA